MPDDPDGEGSVWDGGGGEGEDGAGEGCVGV